MGRICALLLLAAAAWGQEANGPLLVAGRARVPPRLDGQLDEPLWSDAPALTCAAVERLHPSYREEWSGPEDLSFRIRAVVSGEDLYVGIEVTDDVCMHESGGSWWAGDSIELFLDTELGAGEDDNAYSNDDFQIFLLPFHEGPRWGVVARGPDVPYPDGDLRGIGVAHARTATGYVVEARLPLWNFRLRPDSEGRIGFDLALNDVDRGGTDRAESYMTLSGRFDLYSTPSNFGRLAVGNPVLAAPVEAAPTPHVVDWTGLAAGLAAILLVAWTVRRVARRSGPASRMRTATLCGAFAAGAVLCTFLPSLALLLDERLTRADHAEAIESARAAALACLDLDRGGDGERAERVLGLLRDGHTMVRAPHRYTMVPLSAAARTAPPGIKAPGAIRYGIELRPGEARSFPLAGFRTPTRLRLDVARSGSAARERGSVAAEVRLEFDEGPPLALPVPREEAGPVLLDTAERAGEALRAMVVRNRLSFLPLVLDAAYAEEDGRWSGLPLAALGPAGVPLDVWQGRPATHVRRVPREGVVSVAAAGVAGDRLWVALGTEGAYPRTAYGAPAATIRVVYADGSAGPELPLVNGRDLEDRLLSYARPPQSIALAWKDAVRLPVLYTLHTLVLDPARPLDRIEVADLGLLTRLDVAAATVGRRAAAAPPPATGLVLEEDRLAARPEALRGWSGLRFRVRAPTGAVAGAEGADGVRIRVPLPFGAGTQGTLEAVASRGAVTDAILRHRSLVFGFAALLLAFAALVAGGALMHRTRRLRLKMLVTLGAATVVPLLFLAVSLTRVLNQNSENDLKEQTLSDLRRFQDAIAGGPARARELAGSARDTLEIVPAGDPALLAEHLRRSRAEIEGQGAFLRLPEIDAAAPAGLGNAAFFDAVTRSGLYYSPWDGLVAVGVTRAADQKRCLVGLLPAALLGPTPDAEAAAVLFGPQGEVLAGTGTSGSAFSSGAARERARRRLGELERSGQAAYDARVSLAGEPAAAAHAVLREGGRTVGMLAVYRTRAATELQQAQVYRTVLLTTLAALLLVGIAGGTLVDRVTRRLQRVTGAARAIAAGDLTSRVPVEASDEVGRLAASFNTMADALDERVRQLTELHRGLQDMTKALDRAQVARAASALLARATGSRHVQVCALEAATGRLEVLHRRGEGAPLGPSLPETGPARDCVDLKRTIVREGAIFLPLITTGRTVGLAVCAPLGERGAPDRAFLDAAARQIGIALENARLYHDAVTDELTGLYTQSFFLRRLKEEVDRAAATGRPLSLLRIVVEDYRAVARRLGAAVSERLVAETAATVDQVLPRRNMLARRHGGELVALLVESDANAARRHADRIAAALQRREFACLAGEPRPGFAWRTVTYPRDGAAADILMDALLEATEAWDDTATDSEPALKVPPHLGVVLGRSATMRSALEVIARVAPTNATVLLSGETGTGKEVLADLIQANSGRRDRPYVKVNCAAIPDTLVESELFGHEKGAFTGADKRRVGRFEQAHLGTLFLDEVGDLPLPAQSKLLRVLQERRVTRVGGGEPVEVDVRILAATNRDLGDAVRRGAFREDLFHRLHVIELRVPPLRERPEDIPLLVEQFRGEFNRSHSLGVEAFAPDALDALYRAPWPGNVRELRNVVERAMLMAGAAKVELRHLALPDQTVAESPKPAPAAIDGLTPRQERILALARDRGGVTNGEIVQAEAVSPRTALREVQRLVDRGLLVRVGRRRGAVYRPAG